MDGVDTIKSIFKGKEEKLPEGKKSRHVISLVENVNHVFAVHGNLGIQEEVKLGLIAEDVAVQWFKRWLGSREAQKEGIIRTEFSGADVNAEFNSRKPVLMWVRRRI